MNLQELLAARAKKLETGSSAANHSPPSISSIKAPLSYVEEEEERIEVTSSYLKKEDYSLVANLHLLHILQPSIPFSDLYHLKTFLLGYATSISPQFPIDECHIFKLALTYHNPSSMEMVRDIGRAVEYAKNCVPKECQPIIEDILRKNFD